MIEDPAEGGWGVDGVWADDFHHVMRRLLAGDEHGVLLRTTREPPTELARTIRQGWLFTGQPSAHLGTNRGTDPSRIPMRRFVICLQNHDQVGNRAMGDRLHASISRRRLARRERRPAHRADDAAALHGAGVGCGARRSSTSPISSPDSGSWSPRAAAASSRLPGVLERGCARSDPRSAVAGDARGQSPGLDRSARAGACCSARALSARCWRCGSISRRSAAATSRREMPMRRMKASIVSGAKEQGEVFWIVARLRGSGPIDLSSFADARGDEGSDWNVVLSTEEPPFALDPAPPQIDLQSAGPVVHFSRPGAVIFARHRSGVGPQSVHVDEESQEYAGDRPQVRAGKHLPSSDPSRLSTDRRDRDIVPYLARLGVGACYTSPYFTAAPGSTHGYDVADHNEINPEVGGADGTRARSPPRSPRTGWGTSSTSCRTTWASAPATTRAGTICWRTGRARRRRSSSTSTGRRSRRNSTPSCCCRFSATSTARVLERGELQLAFQDGAAACCATSSRRCRSTRGSRRASSRPRSTRTASLGADSPHLNEFLSIITSLQNLPPYTETDPERIAERQREKEVARDAAGRGSWPRRRPSGGHRRRRSGVQRHAGRPTSFDALHELLEAQAYRLAYWRTASHEINYRRFFDVNTLAGLRVEDPEVFDATHRLLGALIRDGKVQAVRIDHPDGLFDPARLLLDAAAAGGGRLEPAMQRARPPPEAAAVCRR